MQSCLPPIHLVVMAGLFSGWIACPAHSKESTSAALPEVISFNAFIRPLMSNTCFVCHGPAGEENPSELRLDSFDAATGEVPSGEGRAIVPGNPEQSIVYKRIMAADDADRMPPEDFRHQLSGRDKAIFRRWIEQGAEYQPHWAYSPLEAPPIPEIATTTGQASHPIDAFILTKLAEAGIKPAQLAGKAELLRRLSLDLISLPPTPEEVAAFLADEQPGAYERQVDRLLASPHYGERMASPWLDIVRFADTVGYHGDQNQRIFAYRDYVIHAFNSNKPFDQFTREQLAGDLLRGVDGQGPTEEQLTATGFTRLNMVTREGGAQPAEYMAKYAADRVRAVGAAWLGSTLGCCECHDHKYDPFSAKDFYSLGAFFADLRQWGVYSSYGYTPNPDLRGFNNNYPFPPELVSKSTSLEERIRFLQQELDERLTDELPQQLTKEEKFRSWLSDLKEFYQQHPDGWAIGNLMPVSADKGTTFEQQEDGSLLLVGEPKKDEVVTLELQLPDYSAAVRTFRLEALPDAAHGGNVGRAANGSFRMEVEFLIQRKWEDTPKQLEVTWGQADQRAPIGYANGYPNIYMRKVWQSLPVKWQLPSDGAQRKHTAVFHFGGSFRLGDGDRLLVRIKSGDLGRVRLSATPLTETVAGWPAIGERLAGALLKASGEWLEHERQAAHAAYYRATTKWQQANQTWKTFHRAIVDCRAGYSHTLIAQPLPAKEIPTMRVLPRGNWQDKSGKIVSPGVPSFLPQPERAEGGRLTRLDLANWLVSRENPLTARHFVNRLWKQFFGAGFSNKLDDLGNQGEWPSHPLLLDWLASDFRDSGWDIKRTVKLIVTSQTYRQRAAYRHDLAEIDPYNRLLAQQSARRLAAEAIRDNALAISGLLESDLIGGPSVFPYQPAGYYANIQFPNRRYSNSRDDRQYRRGVYMHWQRTFLHPMLANFDAPARDECTADRTLSNSPQQALTLLNDPTFVEASRAMAHRLLHEIPQADFATVLDLAFQRALSRPASAQEQESLKKLYETQKNYYAQNPAEAKAFQSTGYFRQASNQLADQLAAWAQVCRVILNLHETITRY